MQTSANNQPRRLPVPGTANLRDIGGYAAGDTTTRWRTLYRADALHRLGPEGREALAELGVRTVIDLREPVEVELDPDDLDGLGAEAHQVPVLLDLVDVRHTRSLQEFYRDIVDRCGPRFVQVVSLLAEDDALPAVIHCSAGKDRTGLVFGLLLDALGVPADVIAADYALTAKFLKAADRADLIRRAVALGLGEQAVAMKMAATPDLMHGVLEHLRATHGGSREYLQAHGLSEAGLERLREQLLVR